jgi:hypothetical protein
MIAFATLLAILLAVGADPVQPLPDAYKLQFENDWVKVVKATYPAHSKLPVHDHPQMATAYVYLNDADTVIFRHSTGSVVRRPATKAGAFRLFRAVRDEHHEVENNGDTASEFLRVEFKTEPKEERTLRGRFAAESAPDGDNLERVQFDNQQVRITRLVCAKGRTLTVATTDAVPALLIALAPATIDVARGSGAAASTTFGLGQERWLDAGQTDVLTNRTADRAEFLRFDFKTSPAK